MADDHGNFINTSTPLLLGSKRNGSIETALDQDMFSIVLAAGRSVTFEAVRSTSVAAGGLTDPHLALFDIGGNRLAHDGSSFGNGNARIHYTVPATGTYYLLVYDHEVAGIGSYWVGAYSRNVLTATNSHDLLSGTALPDTVFMGRGNDFCRGGPGDDYLDGGEGRDTVTYAGLRANFSIERVAVDGWSKTATGGLVVRDNVGTEGNDTVVDVERIRFSDAHLAFDLHGNAGTTVKIIGAVFGAEAVNIEAYVGIGLAQLDSGTSRDSLLALALQARFGGTPSATDLVNVLYANVVGVAPPAADLKFYTDLLDAGVHTHVSLAGLAAETDLNLNNIGFDRLVHTGIGYV
jgi:hypothetical protein